MFPMKNWVEKLGRKTEKLKNWVSLNLHLFDAPIRRQSRLALFLVSADLELIAKGF